MTSYFMFEAHANLIKICPSVSHESTKSTDSGMLEAQLGIITFERVYVGCYARSLCFQEQN